MFVLVVKSVCSLFIDSGQFFFPDGNSQLSRIVAGVVNRFTPMATRILLIYLKRFELENDLSCFKYGYF